MNDRFVPILTLFFFLSFGIYPCFAQENNDSTANTNNITPHTITWDVKNGQINQTIPFDEIITLKVINYPEQYDSLLFNIEQVPVIYKCNKIDKRRFRNQNMVYSEKTDGNTTNIIIDEWFKPNATYKFSFEAKNNPRKPTEEEKEKIKEIVKSAIVNDDFISSLKTSIIIDSDRNITQIINQKDNLLIEKIKSEVKKQLNLNIEFPEKGESKQILNKPINDIVASVDYITNGIENLTSTLDTKKQLYIKSDSILYIKVYSNLKAFERNWTKKGLIDNNTSQLLIVEKADPIWQLYNNKIKQVSDEITKLNSNNLVESHTKEISEYLVDQIVTVNYQTISQTYGGIVEQGKFQTAVDFGMVYVVGVNKFLPSVIYSLYLRPIKRDKPISQYYRNSFWKGLLSTVSLNVGFTASSIVEDDKIKGITDGIDLGGLVGVGFRPTSFMAINTGAFVFQENNPNPTITDYKLTARFYIGLSVDISLRDKYKSYLPGKNK